MSPASALYEGILYHHRRTPREHRFSYPLFLAYLDLEEVEDLMAKRWFWSSRRPALAWFRRSDYLGDPKVPLADAIRRLVEERTGRQPEGPIRLLTHLRYFGYSFNPVSFYYCFAPDGERLETIVAEVTNTPWKERHCYVLDAGSDHGGGTLTFEHDKELHVSPFMEMGLRYRWRFSQPGETAAVYVETSRGGEPLFHATLALKRRRWTGRNLASVLLRFPMMSLKVTFWIHLQALKLWWKRVPFHTHPSELPPEERSAESSAG